MGSRTFRGPLLSKVRRVGNPNRTLVPTIERKVTLGSVSSAEDRDRRTGHFLPGNKAHMSDPMRLKCSALKRALMDSVTPDDIREVLGAMVREAKEGNVFAANLVLDRTMGKVQPATEADAEDVAAKLERLWFEVGGGPRPGGVEPEPEDAAFRMLEPPDAAR